MGWEEKLNIFGTTNRITEVLLLFVCEHAYVVSLSKSAPEVARLNELGSG